MKPVLIVGGGIAGLATAYELHRRSLPFLLLEASSRAGGVILSEEIDGYVVDGGPDALLIQKPEGIALCRELGLGDRLIPTSPPRLAYIQRGSTLHALSSSSVLGVPTEIGPFVRTGLFSWPGKIRMGAELFIGPRKDSDEDESIGAFMTRRFGREATDYLAEPLLAGIHAGDVDRLSLQALFPRFVEAERNYGSLIRAFRSQRRTTTPPPDGAFRSLPGGLSELVRALVAVLPSDAIRLNTPVSSVSIAPPAPHLVNPGNLVNFHVRTESAEAIEASALVIAVPAFAAARLLRDADPVLAGLCDEVRYASTATVAMAFPREAVRHPLNGSGFVVPRVEKTGILAASWLSSKWAHRAPPGRVLLRVFVGGGRDPKALEESDQELIARSLHAIRDLLGIDGAPLLTRIYRWNRASAQHEVGHVGRMQKIDTHVSRHPGLFVTGSGFRSVGIPDCVADGRLTAAQVATFISGPVQR